MDLNAKNKGLACIGELVGTAFLVTAYSLGIQQFGMGSAMVYLMLIVLLHPISGAHLNPAVTIG